jgi:plastocyanin
VRRAAVVLVAAVALAAPGATNVASSPHTVDETTFVAAKERKLRKRPTRKQRRALRGRVTGARAGLRAAGAARPLPATGGAPRTPVPVPSPGVETVPPPLAPPPPTGSGRSVQARTDDRTPAQLKLVLSRTTVLPGDVKVEFNNAFAEDPHDLLVERVDGFGEAYSFDELGPGEVARRTLALDAGEWRLLCTIPTHAERGMAATLAVAG